MGKRNPRNIIEYKIYNLIREDDVNTWHADIVDGMLMLLVVTSVIVAFLSTFNLGQNDHNILQIFEVFFVIVFTLEYALRLWTAELIYPNLPS